MLSRRQPSLQSNLAIGYSLLPCLVRASHNDLTTVGADAFPAYVGQTWGPRP